MRKSERKTLYKQTDGHWGLTANLSIFFGNPVYVHSCHLPHSSHTHTHNCTHSHRPGNMSFVYPLRIVCFVSCINPFYAFYVPNSCLNILLTCLARLLSYSLPHSFSLPPSHSLLSKNKSLLRIALFVHSGETIPFGAGGHSICLIGPLKDNHQSCFLCYNSRTILISVPLT